MMKKMFFLIGILALAVLIAPNLNAQVQADPSRNTVSVNPIGAPTVQPIPVNQGIPNSSPTWGVTSEGSNLWLAATEFSPVGGQTWGYGYAGYLYRASGTFQSFCTDVGSHLQRGTYINGIEINYYDNDAVNDFHAYITRMYGRNVASQDEPWDLYTTGAPGYAYNYQAVGITYDAWSPDYYAYWWLCIDFPVTGTNLMFKGARVYYNLQLSPAPATATFNDVPTSHMFFQYVEALAGSGITSGCTTGYYCPDNYVTRAQMAKYLANALGLHWGL